jgi:3-oxoacyl-[acyl-carrier protein] reductase
MTADLPNPIDRTRLAVISGGGTGIGRALARRFVSSGHDVLIVGRRRVPLEATVAELGPSASFVATDLASAEGAAAVAASLDNRAVDVIVANAGGSRALTPTTLAEMESEWLGDLRNNLLTAVLLEYALRPLLTRPGGRIVGIGSIAAQLGSGFEGSYGAAKAGLHAWMYSLTRA